MNNNLHTMTDRPWSIVMLSALTVGLGSYMGLVSVVTELYTDRDVPIPTFIELTITGGLIAYVGIGIFKGNIRAEKT